MKKIFVLLTLVGVSAMFATTSLAQSSWKDSNATQPKNEIWYTSKDGTIVEPTRYNSQVFSVNGINIVSNTYKDGKGVIVFDDVVKLIGGLAFQKNDNLTSISIPEGVTQIQMMAFAGCTSLSSITIPNGVTDIGKWAFFECTSLTNIIIPNSVVRIEEQAFRDCTSLTSIALPYPSYTARTSLGKGAFANCKSLTSVYCKSLEPPTMYGDNAFEGVPSDCKLYVLTQSVEKYKNTPGWRRFYYNTVGYDFPEDYYDKATNRIRGYNN